MGVGYGNDFHVMLHVQDLGMQAWETQRYVMLRPNYSPSQKSKYSNGVVGPPPKPSLHIMFICFGLLTVESFNAFYFGPKTRWVQSKKCHHLSFLQGPSPSKDFAVVLTVSFHPSSGKSSSTSANN
ncbi:hypothetical protein VNO77_28480 [Canavalia gladiata]|uniref:Uncharacterized protein n=1 Tax=Canavalia gladiata TaxID=3824 RepID=A0AAN9KVJ9_CANGL